MVYYWIYYILGAVMLPGIILGAWAQIKTYSTFKEYSKVQTKHGMSAKNVARFMLDSGGATETKIQFVRGELTDHYNPTTDTVSLSESVYNENSVSAIGVTAHEIGHVFQHKQGYAPIKIKKVLVPIMNISSYFTWPLIILGLILELSYYATMANWLIYIGVGIYALNIILCLITLPIELNASKRAYNMLVVTGEMDTDEAKGVKKVLNAAAWTYVAALVTSILSLLRLLLFIFMARGGKRN